MPSGKRRPVITQQSVEAALHTLIYTTTDTSAAAGLRSLVLVKEYLQNPARPPANDLRMYAVKAILCEIITDRLNHFRQMAGVSPLSPVVDRNAALQSIVEDSRSNNPEFVGWSLLYHRFVRVDLGISLNDFEQWSSIEGRTLRRYRQHAVTKLVDEMIQREWHARERHHRHRLRAKIPGRNGGRLIGRDDDLQRIFQTLSEDSLQTFQVSGAPGIGKTALLRTVAQGLIEQLDYDYVFWIEQAATAQEIYNDILTEVLPQYASADLRELFQSWRFLVILDDCALQLEELNDVIEELAHTTTLIAATHAQPLAHFVHHVRLQELSADAAEELVHEYYASSFAPDPISPQQMQHIWNRVGGNPSGLHLFMQQWIAGDSAWLAGQSLHAIYASVYDTCSHEAQTVWHFFALAGYRGIRSHELETLFEAHTLSRDGFLMLIERFLLRALEAERDHVLPHSALRFVVATYQQDAVRERIDEEVRHFLKSIQTGHAARLGRFIAQILSADWFKLDVDDVLYAVDAYALISLNDEAAAMWWRVYQRYPQFPFSAEARLGFAITARKQHEYHAAGSLFRQVIAATGQQGAFALQSEAVLEEAILLRLQGRYSQAMRQLDWIRKQPLMNSNPSFADRVYHEIAQSLLEQGEGAEAEAYLERINAAYSPRWMQQHVESLALQGRIEEAAQRALDTLERYDDTLTQPERIALFTVLGRVHLQAERAELAVNWFSEALHIAEDSQHRLLMGRCMSNLAGALLSAEQIAEAHPLLEEAQRIQNVLHDPLGLTVTRKNLSVLRRKQVNQS